MDCEGCGACCVDQDISLTRHEQLLTPPEDMEGGMLKKIDGRCIRLDPATRRCTDYENRPLLCRIFRPACAACIVMRAFARRHLGGVEGGPLPDSTELGLYTKFTDPLNFETDTQGRLSRIAHPSADNPTRLALEEANKELPSMNRF